MFGKFLAKIIHLCGYVSKQNNCFWGTENPHIINEEPLDPLKAMAWCGVYARVVIGQTTTVHGERFRAILNDFLLSQIDELGLENMQFQQNGETARTARPTTGILMAAFPGLQISRFDDSHWPAKIALSDHSRLLFCRFS